MSLNPPIGHVPFVNGTGRARQKQRDHVTLDPRDPDGQACLVDGGGREG